MQRSEITAPNGKSSLGLLQDHLELASLECAYEKKEGWRRLLSIGVGVILLISSFIYFQLALVGWFLRMGLSWDGIGLILGIFYFVAGILVIWLLGKRQEGVGTPFQGSLAELKRSLNWIEKRFS